MQWLGLSVGEFAATLLGSGLVVVALYLLKEQRRRVRVPTLALWESLLESRAQAALSTRLRRIFSLLLALTIVLAMLLALADVRSQAARGRNIVVLVDRSASMAATDEPQTRLGAAKRLVRGILSELGPGDRALIAALDRQVTPRCTWSDDRATLHAALDAITQSDMAGALTPGVRFALDALSGRPHPELYVVSDGALPDAQRAQAELGTPARVPVRYLRVGHAERNVGITAFAVRGYALDPGHLEGMLSVENFGKAPEQLTLRVAAAGTLLYEEPLTLAAGERATRALSNLPTTRAPLEASLSLARGPDVLPSDDHAYTATPERRRLRVLMVSDGNRYLEAALLLDEYLDVTEMKPAEYRDAQGFDVAIFDRARPPGDPGVPTLYFAAPQSAGFFPLPLKGERSRPFFDHIEREHPLLEQLSLRDVNLARALVSLLAPGDHALVATADRMPLVVEGTRRAPFLAFTFDVRESDLPLRVAWPLLVLRSVERLAARSEPASSSHLTGEILRASVPSSELPATVETPAGARLPLRVSESQVAFLAERAGLYRVRQGDLEATLTANVDTLQEGAVAARPRLLGADASRPSQARASLWPERAWPWFSALALLLLCVEWVSFHRRWTV